MAPGPGNVHEPLALEFCGVPMDSPIVLLSGCVGFGEEYTRVTGFSNRDAGAICLKGTTLEPRLGNAPHRIDILRAIVDLDFDVAWQRRIEGTYGNAPANWIDLDSLIAIKERIDHPRHREDVRVLKMVKALKESADD